MQVHLLNSPDFVDSFPHASESSSLLPVLYKLNKLKYKEIWRFEIPI